MIGFDDDEVMRSLLAAGKIYVEQVTAAFLAFGQAMAKATQSQKIWSDLAADEGA